MSPFTEYLYLKPLYSIRGGSTTLAEALTKKPGLVFLRTKPLYKWNTFDHLMLVLSFMFTHVNFCTKCAFSQFKQ